MKVVIEKFISQSEYLFIVWTERQSMKQQEFPFHQELISYLRVEVIKAGFPLPVP